MFGLPSQMAATSAKGSVLLFNAQGGPAIIGYKQAFCAIDIERIGANASASGRFHDCNSD